MLGTTCNDLVRAIDGMEKRIKDLERRNNMSTLCNERIEAGDVLELDRDGVLISALVLLAAEDAVILDACDDTTPFVVRRIDLIDYRLFQPEAV